MNRHPHLYFTWYSSRKTEITPGRFLYFMATWWLETLQWRPDSRWMRALFQPRKYAILPTEKWNNITFNLYKSWFSFNFCLESPFPPFFYLDTGCLNHPSYENPVDWKTSCWEPCACQTSLRENTCRQSLDAPRHSPSQADESRIFQTDEVLWTHRTYLSWNSILLSSGDCIHAFSMSGWSWKKVPR